MPIPKERIKRINSGLFDSDVKAYFVNLTSDSKKLHITNSTSCKDSKTASEYIDFDNEKEARIFFKQYGKDIARCEKCFKTDNQVK